MNNISIKVPAKINLLFRIIDKYPDGYHKIESLMQSVSLYDSIKITKIPEKKIIISSNINELNNLEPNTAFNAARLMLKSGKLKEGVKIHLDKNIPLGAGLGGGSADAAGVIYGMNLLFGMDYSLKKLQKLGFSVGADVPFCLNGGLCLVYNRGEKIKPLNISLPFYFVLLKPDFSISTRWAYSEFDKLIMEKNPSLPLFGKGGGFFDFLSLLIDYLTSTMTNDFELVVCSYYLQIKELKDILKELGAIASVMSGSGSTVVGIFLDEAVAKNALRRLKRKEKELKLELATIVRPVGGGF